MCKNWNAVYTNINSTVHDAAVWVAINSYQISNLSVLNMTFHPGGLYRDYSPYTYT